MPVVEDIIKGLEGLESVSQNWIEIAEYYLDNPPEFCPIGPIGRDE